MNLELQQIAKAAYTATHSLFDFLTMCDAFTGEGSAFKFGGALKDGETLDLINWWKNKQRLQTYTIQILPSHYGYLNLGREDGEISVHSNVWTPTVKTGFTKQEIAQLKERDDLAIDWNKAKIEPVEDE
jgi:hypothetical protein